MCACSTIGGLGTTQARRIGALFAIVFNGWMTIDFDRLCADLAASIKLGYDVEGDGPGFPYLAPAEDEIRWLAAWLVSEGWSRSSAWPNK